MSMNTKHEPDATYVVRHNTGRWSAIQYLGAARIPTTVVLSCSGFTEVLATLDRLRAKGLIAKTQTWIKYAPNGYTEVGEGLMTRAANIVRQLPEIYGEAK